jgi:ubiquinone/menaquinone biosynthesis C-methylase UbiE
MSFLTQWMARRHGGIAVMYEKFTAPLERAGLAAIRARLAGDLTGCILEIGCGTGLNFPHYLATAEVTAIEPLEEFRVFAARRAQTVGARITVQEGDAQALPFADQSFDAAFETLAFCSVPDAAQGLRELRRVVKPGAPVRFFEHVRSAHPGVALVQDLTNPLWRWLMDGCNINRDTVAAIRAAGFTVDSVQTHALRVPQAPRFPMREIHARA